MNKKAIALEGLLRIIVTVVLVVIALNVGKKAGEAAGLWGKSYSIESLNNLANDLNSPNFADRESKQEILRLDKKSVLVGFSKGWDFQCYGCGGNPQDKLSTKFKRPTNSECRDSACVCVCTKGLPKITGGQTTLEVECQNPVCAKLNSDIVTKVELGELIKKKYSSANRWSSWQGGFLYTREVGETDAMLSGLPKEFRNENSMSLVIEKRAISGITFVGVCPGSPCINEQLLTTTT